MRIVVDSDIWGADALFAGLGDVTSLPAGSIDSTAIRHADALIVRSVTRVDECLLAGSSVRFVGTATAGTDHVDRDYLNRRGIVLAAAEGCNARPVVEYVISCLFEWRRRTGRSFAQSIIGVIGVGRIGRGVADWAEALGMRAMSVDPPLARAGQPGLCKLEESLSQSDIITLHVPLTKVGPDATQGMIDACRLGQMKRGAWLINAARGGVVMTEDLIAAIASMQLGGVILDVWAGEPAVSVDLLRNVTLLTPHIAGYSAGAHRRAAERIAGELSNWMAGRAGPSNDANRQGAHAGNVSPFGAIAAETDLRVIEKHVNQVCQVRAIDAQYRQSLKSMTPAEAFESVRRACRRRSELADVTLDEEAASKSAVSTLNHWAASVDDRPRLR